MNTVTEIAPKIGIATACLGLGVARATFYRAQHPVSARQPRPPRPASPRALSVPEQHTILEWLHAPAYADLSPRTVFAMLLDAGRYLASVSTFYRLLRAAGETRGRRNELTHPAYAKPELCQGFFAWYNHAHRHSGIGYMTPAAVHTGQAPRLYAARQQVLDEAFVAHPERFTRRRHPTPPALPLQVGINLPKPSGAAFDGQSNLWL